MNRREVLTLLGGGAAATAIMRPDIRALAQSGAAGSTLTYGQSTAILTLDPAHGAFTTYPGGYEAALCLYDRILDFDADMQIKPELAESFAMADDLMSATIKLRSGLKFHDGTPVDAAAIKANIERMIDKERNPTNRPLWDPIESAEATDDLTVVLKLKQPFSQLPNSLAHGSGAIVSPAAMEKFGDDKIATNPVGAGPYRLASFSPGQELVLEAFEDYWGEKPKAGKIVFKAITEAATRISALKTGAVNVIDQVPPALVSQLKGDANIEVISKPGLRPIGCIINMSREPLKDPKVRKALNLAIPVKTIAEKVFFGYAQAPDSPLAFNTVGYSSVSPLVYDVEQAKSLLAEAGYVAVSEIVANALGQAGVKVEITKIEGGSYWDTLRQAPADLKWDIAMFGFNPSNASGLYHLSSLFKSNPDEASKPAVWNAGRYKNDEVDALLQEADSTADAAKQMEALAKVQEIVWNDNPYIWLQINENIAATNGAKGVEVWPIVFTVVRRASV